MRRLAIAWLAPCLIFAIQGTALPDTINSICQDGCVENYFYEAKPLTEGSDTEKEEIEVDFLSDSRGITYASKIVSAAFTEAITIYMDNGGGFVKGMRTLTEGKRVTKEEVGVDADSGYVKRTTSRTKTSLFKIPRGKKLACDGSLLGLLRTFPFNSDTEWTLFMVDFSGETITVTVHQVGKELVSVPAGEFECFRIEVIVHIPILRPKLVYWVTVDEPHFMVKSIGKRGPFTRNYVTVLKARDAH